ncbi:MAG: class I SAM-dependent methyltransferase [Smithellaceae bacterium]
MVFNHKTAILPDERLKTSLGHYLFSRQKELMLELVSPRAGERTLCTGNATGSYLQIFRDKWCSVTGLASSEEMLETTRKQMGEGIELHLGKTEDLPFSDDEFDIVVVINALEIAQSPQKAIAEAIRVCRGRVFIGFINKYSFAGTRQRLKEIFGFPLAEKIRFFSIEEIKEMVGSLIDTQTIQWGSVIYFPAIVYDISTELEELVPHIKNPLGAFVGMTFPVKYTYRTAQNPLVESYQLKTEPQVSAPEAVRSMLQETHK